MLSLDETEAAPITYTIKASKLARPKRHEIEKAYQRRKWYQDEETLSGAQPALEEGLHVVKTDKHSYRPQDVSGKEARSVRSGDKISPLPPTIESSEHLYYLPIYQIGLVDLERVQDSDEYSFRIRSRPPAIVAECPSQGVFVTNDLNPQRRASKGMANAAIRCVGDEDIENIRIRGAGQMTVRWTEQEESRSPIHHVIRDIEFNVTEVQREVNAETALETISRDVHMSASLASRRLSTAKDVATSHNHNVSLALRHSVPGTHEVQILTIEDGLHNIYHPDIDQARLMYQVQDLPTASFSQHQPLPRSGDHLLMKENSSVALVILVNKDRNAKEAIVEISYEPEPGTKHIATTQKISVSQDVLKHTVAGPGTYALHQVTAGRCQGLVRGLTSLTIKEVPPPTARVEYIAERDW